MFRPRNCTKRVIATDCAPHTRMSSVHFQNADTVLPEVAFDLNICVTWFLLTKRP
jgi:hypothetical protein